MRVGMFLGVETATWSVNNFLTESQYLHAQGIDTILVKVADGGNLWYGGYSGIDNVLAAIKNGGCAVVPYTYSYGDQFGYLNGEAGIVNQLLSQGYDVCMDMEVEWNGQVGWAQRLVGLLSRPIYVSTWADPDLQAWDQVLKVLEPKTVKFMPQVYTPWLQANWNSEYQALGIQNNKIWMTVSNGSIYAAKGWDSVNMWEAETLSRAQVSEVIKSLTNESSSVSNTNVKNQSEDLWSKASGINPDFSTGIAKVWESLYMGEVQNFGNVDLGSPRGPEFDTNDWNGVPIKYQEFTFGHIEWYPNTASGHTAGEHHVWLLGHKLF